MPSDARHAVVIVVEDNLDNLFITEILLCEDLKVQSYHGVESGRALFNLLKANPTLKPDLILLDIQLPEENGYMILDALQGLPQCEAAKVVAVTANVMPNDVTKAQEVGFDGMIGKPIHRHRFPEQIQRVLQGDAVWEPY